MPRYGLTPSVWDQFKRATGRSVANGRAAPTASLDKMDDIHQGVGRAYDYAEMRGEETPDGFKVDDWQMPSDQSPRQVGLRKTSLNDWLEQNAYGDYWDQVRNSLLSLPQATRSPMSPDYSGSGSLKKALDRPLYIATVQNSVPGDQSKSSALPHFGVVQLSPQELARYNSSVGAGAQHEVAHVASPPGPLASLTTQTAKLNLPTLSERLLAEHPSLGKPALDRAATDIGSVIRYRNRPSEFMATLGNMRRHELGLTGNTMTTPELVSRAFDRWLGGKAPVIRKGLGDMRDLPGGYGRFDDPVMEHGPNAGQPAENFEDMRESFRHIYDQADPKTKKLIHAMAPYFTSTQEGETDGLA
jgi:hypothetical protein